LLIIAKSIGKRRWIVVSIKFKAPPPPSCDYSLSIIAVSQNDSDGKLFCQKPARIPLWKLLIRGEIVRFIFILYLTSDI
jgi:hypothetical protein